MAARASFMPSWAFARLNVAQRCMRFFFRVCRIPLAVQGLENLPASGPYVIASNHTSYLDGAVLVAVLPWRRYAFVATRELADNFLSRVLVRGLGAVFVEKIFGSYTNVMGLPLFETAEKLRNHGIAVWNGRLPAE